MNILRLNKCLLTRLNQGKEAVLQDLVQWVRSKEVNASPRLWAEGLRRSGKPAISAEKLGSEESWTSGILHSLGLLEPCGGPRVDLGWKMHKIRKQSSNTDKNTSSGGHLRDTNPSSTTL